jgi:hypothetical protein
VDREVQIIMRGRDLRTRLLGDNESGRERAQVESDLPDQNGYVSIQVQQGRGNVDVIQQPTARNGYTAIVRIRDDASGADWYRITASWQPRGYGNSDWDDRHRSQQTDTRDRDGDRRTWGRDRNDNGSWQRDRDDRESSARDRDDAGASRGDSDDRDGGYDNGGWDARSSGMLHWTGRVDDVEELRIQGRRVDYVTLSGNGVRVVRSDMAGRPLPRGGASVRVQQHGGRGSVTVVQQPNAWNGYTAVIRVRDPQPGFGYYDFDVLW